MYDHNSWDSDSSSQTYNGAIGLPIVYFEGIYDSEWNMQLSPGTYSLIAQWNTYATMEAIQWNPIDFFLSQLIDTHKPGPIRFTGATNLPLACSFCITDIQY